MKLTVIHENPAPSAANGESLLRMALSGQPLADLVFEGMSRSSQWLNAPRLSGSVFSADGGIKQTVLVPESWGVETRVSRSVQIVCYADKIAINNDLIAKARLHDWLVVSNGRFVTRINNDLLDNILAGIDAPLLAVNAESQLLAASEKVRPTVHGKVAGFRRLYDDSAELSSLPTDWPHHLLIRADAIDRVVNQGTLPESFSNLMEASRSNGLKCSAVKIAGCVLDIDTEQGLLGLCRTGVFNPSCESHAPISNGGENGDANKRKPRIVGDVLFGQGVSLAPDVVIAGPGIVGERAVIKRGAVISSAIIGSDVSVPEDSVIRDSVLMRSFPQRTQGRVDFGGAASAGMYRDNALFDRPDSIGGVYRNWPKFAYPGIFKRIADIVFAAIVLLLFAPVMPFIALAVKLTSPGPVFYKDKRQGRYGKTFDCIKFRTMRTGADRIQEKLRVASQVDGPQFKIDNDPRITAVGSFLRNTYIDEIPQFFNVLFGQMSVVGPRPSPEAENTLCPYWRDARLSVRPGITGLWQIYRTRKPGRDFQEWIHYDMKYIRHISFRVDLKICALTIRKLVDSFISQF